jgi:hypothetical protein
MRLTIDRSLGHSVCTDHVRLRVVRATLRRMTTDPARFDRVSEHPDYPATANRAIELPYGSISAIAAPSGFALFGVLFLILAIGVLVEVKPPLWFAIPFVAGVLMFIGGGAGMAARGIKFHNTPIVRLVAVITKERTEVSGGANNTRTHTTYCTTLQTRDGTRAEYVTPDRLVGKLALDDIGVAYIKGHMLVEFTRFEV